MKREAYVAAAGHSVGIILNKILVKLIISVVGQISRHAPAFGIKLVGGEAAAALQLRAVAALKRTGHAAVLDVIIEPPYQPRLAGMKGVNGRHLVLAAPCRHIGRSIHISHGAHGKGEVVARTLCLNGIIYHRLLAYHPQAAVQPVNGVAAGKSIGCHGDAEKRKPF